MRGGSIVCVARSRAFASQPSHSLHVVGFHFNDEVSATSFGASDADCAGAVPIGCPASTAAKR